MLALHGLVAGEGAPAPAPVDLDDRALTCAAVREATSELAGIAAAEAAAPRTESSASPLMRALGACYARGGPADDPPPEDLAPERGGIALSWYARDDPAAAIPSLEESLLDAPIAAAGGLGATHVRSPLARILLTRRQK